MKLTYDAHYKDRTPEETIQLVQEFFTSKGLTIKQNILRQETSSTWTASLAACYDNDVVIATSNGKGVSKIFCLASAHAELYERFCNKIFACMNPILYNRVMKESYKLNGFYFSPGEKELTFEEMFDSACGRLFLESMQDNPNDLKVLFNKIFENKFVGVPFKHLVTEEVQYFDPRILIYLNNSTGMAAGNTYYEAVNQGMSEMYEHLVEHHAFLDQTKTYILSDKALQVNDTIIGIMNAIKEKNDLYVIDCSYSYNVPVLMSIIVNKKTHAVSYNFGASPIFEIALERILTELYQGTYDFDTLKEYGPIPFRGNYTNELADYIWPGTTITKTIFPEEFILTGTYVDEYNKDIFISGNYSNEDIYAKILDINQRNNFNVYVYDCSLSDKLYAIKLFETNIPVYQSDPTFAQHINNKITYISQTIAIYNFIEQYLETGIMDIKQVNKIIALNERIKKDRDARFYMDRLCGLENWFLIGAGRGNCVSVFDLAGKILTGPQALKYNNEMLGFLSGTSAKIYDPLIQYTILLRYLEKIDLYSTEELFSIFNFLNLYFSETDLVHLQDSNYWMEKICFGDLKSL